MSGLIIITLSILVFIVIYQVAKASEFTTIIRGEHATFLRTNRFIAWLMVVVFVLGFWGIWECHRLLMPYMLPEAASNHGEVYDSTLKTMLYVTVGVFIGTHILLFYFIFKYQYSDKRKALFYPYNNTLEVLWTTVPASVLIVLGIFGIINWFKITGPPPAKDTMVVQIVGKQFNWVIRYPGPDGILGKTDFRKINDAHNVLGLDWDDPAALDDIIIGNGEMHLAKDVPVQLVINSRDVVHSVGLPHFRMKMDAVPGITTTIWFTPTITTQQMVDRTGNKDFVYEIACDQMCGNGHYSMRGTIIVDERTSFKAWLGQQPSYYSTVKDQIEKPDAPAEEATASVQTVDNQLP